MDFAEIKLLILDVDGVLTDGRVTPAYTPTEPDTATPVCDEGKRFHVRDGCVLKLWHQAGGRTAILSGRTSVDVTNRAAELGIEIVRMGKPRKISAYEEVCTHASCQDAEVAYVGDDLPDLGPMMRCALPIAVRDAASPVKRVARYVTSRRGGAGAVAEAVEWVLRKQRRWPGPRLFKI